MEIWILLALATLVIWGIWGFFSKLAVERLNPKHALIYEIIGEVVVAVLISIALKPVIAVSWRNSSVGIAAGAIMIIGILTFFIALKKWKSSVVVPLTALYPVVAIILGFIILKESVSMTQGIGIAVALTAAYLLGEGE